MQIELDQRRRLIVMSLVIVIFSFSVMQYTGDVKWGEAGGLQLIYSLVNTVSFVCIVFLLFYNEIYQKKM